MNARRRKAVMDDQHTGGAQKTHPDQKRAAVAGAVRGAQHQHGQRRAEQRGIRRDQQVAQRVVEPNLVQRWIKHQHKE